MRPMSYRTLPDFYWGWLSNANFNTLNTRMHSSRMRTVRSSGAVEGGVSQHALGGGVCPGGCLPSACWDTPPVDRMTDACKNITLPQLRCGR